MAKKKHNKQSRKIPTASLAYQPQIKAKPAWQLVDRHTDKRFTQAVEHTLIDLDDENSGEAAWRRREAPRCRVHVPHELLCLGDGNAEYATLARDHGVFISRLDITSDSATEFGIWGIKNDANKALQAIRDWISREKVSKNASGASKFTGVQMFTPKERERAERAWSKEVQRQKFRQAPLEGTLFDTIGKYTCDNGSNIEEAFGRSLEALDAIRIKCGCHIIRADGDRRIQVLGSDLDTVSDALARIRTAWLQLHAREVKATTYYFPVSVGESVTLHEYTHMQVLSGVKAARPPGKTYRNSDDTNDTSRTPTDSPRLNAELLSIMEAAVKKLPCLQGHVSFEIRLGTFLATQHMQPIDGIYSQNEFVDMLTQSQFIGSVTSELGNADVEQNVFDLIDDAGEIFEPLDVTHLDLQDIKPAFAAIIFFVEGAVHIQLTMTWQQQGDGNRSEVQYSGRHWSKADRMQVIDTNVLNLEDGYAWHVDLHATTAIKEQRIPPHLVRFADRVKFDEEALTGSDPTRPLIRFPPLKSLKSMRTESTRAYRCKTSPYVLKVVKFQDREYIAQAPGAVTTYEPRVSAALFNPAWSRMLIQNEVLKVGDYTEWSDCMLDWFPSPSSNKFALDGIAHLTSVLSTIGKAVFSSEHGESDQSTGMTIG